MIPVSVAAGTMPVGIGLRPEWEGDRMRYAELARVIPHEDGGPVSSARWWTAYLGLEPILAGPGEWDARERGSANEAMVATIGAAQSAIGFAGWAIGFATADGTIHVVGCATSRSYRNGDGPGAQVWGGDRLIEKLRAMFPPLRSDGTGVSSADAMTLEAAYAMVLYDLSTPDGERLDMSAAANGEAIQELRGLHHLAYCYCSNDRGSERLTVVGPDCGHPRSTVTRTAPVHHLYALARVMPRRISSSRDGAA